MERRDDRWSQGVSRREFLERTIELGAGLAVLGGCVPRRGIRESASPFGALEARYDSRGDELSLSNDAITASWSVAGGALRALRVRDERAGRELAVAPQAFSLVLADGRTLTSDRMRVVRGPVGERLAARRGASRLVSRLAERQAGRQLTVVLQGDANRLRATLRQPLRDGAP